MTPPFRASRAVMAAALLCSASMAVGQDGLRLRAGAERDAERSSAVVERLDADGVHTESGAVVPWHWVLAVPDRWAEDAGPFLEIGDELWRAGRRVARGDRLSAEPMLEDLESLYLGRSGATASEVHARLFQCRAPRAAAGAAARSWLAWRWSSGFRAGPSGELPSEAVDASTGLVPAFPPVFTEPGDEARLEQFVLALPSDDASRGQELARAIAVLYHHAARFEAGSVRAGTVPGVSGPVGADSGVSLVRWFVVARAGSSAERAEARRALEALLRSADSGWVEAWCRIGIGRSLLAESGRASAEQGLIQLLHVPARWDVEHPGLAAMALGEAAVAASESGAPDMARALADELRQRYAGHPALRRPKVREILATLDRDPPRGQPAGRPEGEASP